MGWPSQNSMPFESMPNGKCEQAPRISGFTPSAWPITVSTVVRGVVVSVAIEPDRQLTMPV